MPGYGFLTIEKCSAQALVELVKRVSWYIGSGRFIVWKQNR
jgi:hypothetical protein